MLERIGRKNKKEREESKREIERNEQIGNRPFFENIAKNLFGIIKL